MPHVNKKIRSFTNFFHNSIFRSLQNSDINKKITLFFLHTSFCSATKSLQNFSTVSFLASKSTPIKLSKKGLGKKGLLQYSSSSRKKRQRPNIIQIL